MNKEGKGRKQRKSGREKKVFFIIALFSLLVLGIASAFMYVRVGIGVNKGKIGYCMQDEKLVITWQTVSDKKAYRLSRYEEESETYILCGEYDDGRAELTNVAPGQELRLKMQGVRMFHVLGYDLEMLGNPRILTIVPEEVNSPVLSKTADIEKKSMKVTWDTRPGDRYEVYLMNEDGTFGSYTETAEGEITFRMEEHAELSAREEDISVGVRTIRSVDDYILYSAISDPAVINRVDFMDDEVYLTLKEEGELRYILSWQESKSDWYELQEWSYDDRKWISRQVYRWSDALTYDTGRLASCTRMRFRLVTYDDEGMRDRKAYTAASPEVTFRTMISPVYCTIWPLTTLPVSDDISGENVIGQVPAGKALCVLEETEGHFLVRYDDEYGYIDSRYCLIDLAEYLGNLCQYNITNGYSSIFRVHGYDIPEVTENVIAGYENIIMEDGQMLVPYLYPCAQKLYQAASQAQEDGYILCIYDAFRPNEATRYLYDMTEGILNQPVLDTDSEDEEDRAEDQEISGDEDRAEDQEISGDGEKAEDQTMAAATESAEGEDVSENDETDGFPESGLEVSEELREKVTPWLEELTPASIGSIKGLSEEGLTVFYTLPQETLLDMGAAMPGEPYGSDAAAVSLLTPEDLLLMQGMVPEDIPILKEMPWEELLALKRYVDQLLTYRDVMTDNRFRLGSFLAQAVSTHNRGIALDLTLVSTASEEELEMQSDMHDLSWYSISARNNENADLLAFYMKGAGYNGLSSEWWHFQDDETRDQLQLGYLEAGVSPEGWKKDELGWKYRLADGSYYYAVTVMIEKKECTFNEAGYLVVE